MRWLPGLDRRRWILVTTLIAGLGWAAASAPAAMSGPGDGSAPPILLVLIGAAGLGVAMGAVLGAAQASVLRRHVRHPRRWIGASAAAWAPAMMIIFIGATAPGSDWPVATVVLLGTATGALAGAALGTVTWWFLPTLDGAPLHNRIVLRPAGLAGAPRHGHVAGDPARHGHGHRAHPSTCRCSTPSASRDSSCTPPIPRPSSGGATCAIGPRSTCWSRAAGRTGPAASCYRATAITALRPRPIARGGHGSGSARTTPSC